MGICNVAELIPSSALRMDRIASDQLKLEMFCYAYPAGSVWSGLEDSDSAIQLSSQTC